MIGAGDGNRTHAASLEGWNSTIELHPHMQKLKTCLNIIAQRTALVKGLSKIFLIFYFSRKTIANRGLFCYNKKRIAEARRDYVRAFYPQLYI